jgi:hypothetical protein
VRSRAVQTRSGRGAVVEELDEPGEVPGHTVLKVSDISLGCSALADREPVILVEAAVVGLSRFGLASPAHAIRVVRDHQTIERRLDARAMA